MNWKHDRLPNPMPKFEKKKNEKKKSFGENRN